MWLSLRNLAELFILPGAVPVLLPSLSQSLLEISGLPSPDVAQAYSPSGGCEIGLPCANGE